MANNVFEKNQKILYNSIPEQRLTYANQLTVKSWNDIVNILKTQANINADYIERLHKWLIGTGTGNVAIEGTKPFVEYILTDYVSLTRSQEIEGDKIFSGYITADNISTFNDDATFNSSVYVKQSPLENTHATNKGYVDNALIKKANTSYVDSELEKKVDTELFQTATTAIIDSLTKKANSDVVEYISNDYVSKTKTEQISGGKLFKDDVAFNKNVQLYGNPTESVHAVTKGYVDQQVSAIPKFAIKVVNELPATGLPATVYLKVIEDDDNANLYEEYIYVEDKWERLGLGKVDLSDYIKIDETKEAETDFTIATSADYNTESDAEVPTTKAVHIIVRQYAGGNTSKENNSKEYTIPLGEASWLRIAKVKDTSKIASGIFTFNSYGIKEDGSKDTLNAVTFSVNSGINRVKQVYGDVLPLSVSPEMSGSSSSDGSVDTPSSASVVEEDIPAVASEDEILAVSSDVPSSSVGGSGSGNANSFGLTTVTIEEYEQEIYVCGLVSFPNVEYYKAFEVELILENNSNYEPLEIFEKVDFTMVDSKGQMPVLEGFTFEEGKNYNFILKGNLQDLYDSSNNNATLGVHINHIDEETGEMVPFKVADMRYVEDTEYGCGMIWKETFLNIESSVLNHGNPYNRFTGNTILTFGSAYGCYDNVEINVIEKIKETIIPYIYHYNSIDDSYSTFAETKIIVNQEELKISIAEMTEQFLGTAYLNGEVIELNTIYTINLSKDILIIVPNLSEGGGVLEYNIIAYLDNATFETKIPYTSEKNITVENYEIVDNNPYNLSLMVEETVKHNIIEKYNLHSIYNKVEKLEDDLIKGLEKNKPVIFQERVDLDKYVPGGYGYEVPRMIAYLANFRSDQNFGLYLYSTYGDVCFLATMLSEGYRKKYNLYHIRTGQTFSKWVYVGDENELLELAKTDPSAIEYETLTSYTTKEYVDEAISNAITKVLNEEV